MPLHHAHPPKTYPSSVYLLSQLILIFNFTFPPPLFFFFFFFNDPAPPEIYPLPLHDAFPISPPPRPSTCRILIPSMRSIGLTDSRMMPSSLSISRMRMADRRASGERRFWASFIKIGRAHV